MAVTLGAGVRAWALLGMGLAGCGSPPHDDPHPQRPATVSLSVGGSTVIDEAANPKVAVRVGLDRYAAYPVTVELDIAGSATSGSDYAEVEANVTIPASSSYAEVVVDVYRDFVEEAAETVEIALGEIAGNAQAGPDAAVTLTILDGGAASVDRMPEEPEPAELELLPLAYTVTPDAVVLIAIAINSRTDGAAVPLVAQWSTDADFGTDVRLIDSVEVEPIDDEFDLFLGGFHVFAVPLEELGANGVYYVRAYMGAEPPVGGFGEPAPNVFFNGFATDSGGNVVVRCEAPTRDAQGPDDPLFSEQWHLRNTGQTAFSDRGGSVGEDLRMAGALSSGLGGDGVKLAVVDTGLETCHPDLAANTVGGGSFNFAHGQLAFAGASPAEPFHFGLMGDHGTSVAGVAAAAADNGLGGRGVSPGVRLVGFNPAEAGSADAEDPEAAFQTAMLLSLGGSDSAPDSGSVDVFNMSFGIFAPGENSREEFVRSMRSGTEELRSGRGALYVKAAGNDFDACKPRHPFNLETGCVSANADPDGNLPWLVNVGGFNADGVRASYSSAGANLWVAGPSGEDGIEAPAMITTDQAGAHGGYSQFAWNRLVGGQPMNRDGDYVGGFGGTSAATPAVAGAISILLGVEPALTWRDVKHILAATARGIDPDIPEARAAFGGSPYVAQHAWQVNAAGYAFHNWYGFGAVDVDAAVAMAEEQPPDGLGELVESAWFGPGAEAEPLAVPDADGSGASATVDVAGVPGHAAIEAVVLEVSAEHPNPFDLGITLRSPSGTESVVNPPFNTALEGEFGLHGWRLLSNAFYGESPGGAWTVHVADLAEGGQGSLTGWRIRFHYGDHGPP